MCQYISGRLTVRSCCVTGVRMWRISIIFLLFFFLRIHFIYSIVFWMYIVLLYFILSHPECQENVIGKKYLKERKRKLKYILRYTHKVYVVVVANDFVGVQTSGLTSMTLYLRYIPRLYVSLPHFYAFILS